MNNKNNKPKGFMALINVLVVSSIAIVILTSLTNTLVWENQIIVDSVNTDQAYYLAQACAEEGLMRIRRDLTYSAGSLVIDAENSCSVLISNVASDFILTAEGKSHDQNQTIQIKFNITTETDLRNEEDDVYDRNNLTISSWERI